MGDVDDQSSSAEAGADPAAAAGGRSWSRRRRIGVGAILLAGVAAVIIAISAGGGSGGPGTSRSKSASTIRVERRDLVQSDNETGTLGYADSRPVVNRISGTITWLPAPGRVVGVNHTLFRVDDQPVVLLDGSVPAYRALQAGIADGPDVLELERNLHALGYDSGAPLTVDRAWDAATTAAVERWQAAHDLTVNGSIALGSVVFQPGGARRVASVQATLGGTGSGGGGAGAATATGASFTGRAAAVPAVLRTTGSGDTTGHMLAVAYRAATADCRATTQTSAGTPAADATAGGAPVPCPPAEEPHVPAAKPTPKAKPKSTGTQEAPKQRSGSAGARAGTSGGGGGAFAAASGGGSAAGAAAGGASGAAVTTATTVMTTTSTRQQVTVDLDTGKQSVAVVGARVTVQLPSGADAGGRIVSVGKVATATPSTSSGTGGSSSSSSSAATIPVSIRLNRTSADGLDQAPVSVSFEQSRARNVLAVPVTALIARPGGTFAVEVVEGGARRLLAVTPGVYTSGYAQVSGPGLRSGMLVTNAAD